MSTSKKILIVSSLFLLLIITRSQSNAQNVKKLLKKTSITYIGADSLFSLNFRFRMQNRVSMNTISTKDLSTQDWEMRVRRLRLRFDGFMLTPKLTYAIQLSFTRGDMDWSDAENSKINVAPNPVRDAMIFYKPTKAFTIGFGQGKLPGNRQRVNSSGELQFADRSIVNSTFNIDRDFGGFFIYELPVKKTLLIAKLAISQGEGRQNVAPNSPGLCYTSRLEFLPFGAFTNKGDYFEGDLEREKTPKLSLAGGYSLNNGALRTGGQLGRDLPTSYDIGTTIIDGVFKYNGWAVASEYINRQSPNQPTVTNLTTANYIYTGYGWNNQISYCFKNRYEIAGRYAIIEPNKKSEAKATAEKNYSIGVSKYLNAHRTKLQLNAGMMDKYNLATNKHTQNLNFTFQIELGI